MKIKVLFLSVYLLLCMLAFSGPAVAADGNSSKGLIAVGMGLAVGLSALGTGLAQARIGAAVNLKGLPKAHSGDLSERCFSDSIRSRSP